MKAKEIMSREDEIILGLRENACSAIELGVADYKSGSVDNRRYITAVRNLFCGLLLLYKAHLALITKAQGCFIIKAKTDWELKDGVFVLKPFSDGDKTLDVAGIREAFARLGIKIDNHTLNRVNRYRNQAEHLYDEGGDNSSAVMPHVVDLIKLARDFITETMEMPPERLLSKEVLSVLLSDEEVVRKEREEKDRVLSELKWYRPNIKAIFSDIVCPTCKGEFLLPRKVGVDAGGNIFVCRTCGHVETYENLMAYYTDDIFIGNYEAHIKNSDGCQTVINAGTLWECPSCSTIGFDTSLGLCLVCGFEGRCNLCGEQISAEDMPSYTENGLCAYCNQVRNKDE